MDNIEFLLPGSELPRILRMREFLDHDMTIGQDHKQLKFEVDRNGTVVVTATYEEATARFAYQPLNAQSKPGAMLYPFEELENLAPYCRYGDLFIRGDRSTNGQWAIQTEYAKESGRADYSFSHGGNHEDFLSVPIPDGDECRSVMEIFAPELARGIHRMLPVVDEALGPEFMDDPLHSMFVYSDPHADCFEIVGISSDHGAIGRSDLLLAGGTPFSALVPRGVFGRALRLSYNDHPKTWHVIKYGGRTHLLRIGPYGISFFGGDAQFPDHRQICGSIQPPIGSSYEVEVVASVLLGPLKERRRAVGPVEHAIALEFDNHYLHVYDAGSGTPFWRQNVDPRTSIAQPIRICVNLSRLCGVLEGLLTPEVVFRFTEPDAAIELVENARKPEYRIIVAPSEEGV